MEGEALGSLFGALLAEGGPVALLAAILGWSCRELYRTTGALSSLAANQAKTAFALERTTERVDRLESLLLHPVRAADLETMRSD